MSGGQVTHYSTGKAPGPTSSTADEQAEASPRPAASGKAMGTFSFLQIVATESSTRSTSDRRVKDVLLNRHLRSVFSKLFLIVPYWAWDGWGGEAVFAFIYLFIVLEQTSKAKWTANSKKL